MTGIAASLSSFDVTFLLPGITVPDDVLILVSIANFGAMDLGLNFFAPPSIGSSLSTSWWVNDGTVQSVTAAAGEGNLFLQLDATDVTASAVPEPSTLSLILAGAVVAGVRRRLQH